MARYGEFWLAGAAVASSVLFTFARAELPPIAYADPKASSEILVVEVAEVTSKESGSDERKVDYLVKVQARVREVVKSGKGLKQGDIIVIRYSAWKAQPPKPGQSPVVGGEGTLPILEKSQVYRVHLEPDKVSHEHKKEPYYAPRGAPYNAMVKVDLADKGKR